MYQTGEWSASRFDSYFSCRPRPAGVSHECVRQWAQKFGQKFCNRIRRHAPDCGDKWHINEVDTAIHDSAHWPWRAVNQDGIGVDVLVQNRHDRTAAWRLIPKFPKKSARAPQPSVSTNLNPTVRREGTWVCASSIAKSVVHIVCPEASYWIA